ncbi:hypothetical protein MMC07_007373 [Pseudocyphellaria aurata]|nr:hypothetical protein [Pseudocyphellaria aurata]
MLNLGNLLNLLDMLATGIAASILAIGLVIGLVYVADVLATGIAACILIMVLVIGLVGFYLRAADED